ncbi:MAG TPA: roadblock/LC7 domain-containing protein [Nitrospirota bacterium]|jgi:predicted regulator of Ras-like GTPase activity (Roadblock/LC7/MglB family)
MSFSEILKKATEEIKGSMGAVIVGMDGIVVEEYLAVPGIDLQSISAEYGNILKEVQSASASLQLGDAEELAIQTENNGIVIRKINKDYFIAILLSPNAILGKGRFVARVAVNQLQKEF